MEEMLMGKTPGWGWNFPTVPKIVCFLPPSPVEGSPIKSVRKMHIPYDFGLALRKCYSELILYLSFLMKSLNNHEKKNNDNLNHTS